ncbi:hypothetical protein DFH07DRAFT_690627, partial [Mycena maculata]
DEGSERIRDGNGREKEVTRWEFSSGRAIGRVGARADVTRVNGDARVAGDGVNLFENVVRLFVCAPPVPPTFDDTIVIPVDNNVSWLGTQRDDDTDEEFEPDGFRPQDFSVFAFPL